MSDEHKSSGRVISTAKESSTVTTTVSTTMHDPDVSRTVYFVVADGRAVGFCAVGSSSPVVGLHEYELAPCARNCAAAPAHIVASPVADIEGTRTRIVAVSVHPLAEAPMTVNLVVEDIVALGAAIRGFERG